MPTAIEAVKDSAPCGGKDDERPAVPTIVDMDNAKAATHVAPDNAASKVSSMGRPVQEMNVEKKAYTKKCCENLCIVGFLGRFQKSKI